MRELTKQEYKFAMLYADGLRASEAAKRAGYKFETDRRFAMFFQNIRHNKEFKQITKKRLRGPKLKVFERHKISESEYLKILKQQKQVCAICKKKTDLFVDHNHKCCNGKTGCNKCVRGLLCCRCNSGLGMFKDSLSFLENAIQYLNGVK